MGHDVSNGKVAHDPEKLKAVTNWPVPKSVKALEVSWDFLGFTAVSFAVMLALANL